MTDVTKLTLDLAEKEYKLNKALEKIGNFEIRLNNINAIVASVKDNPVDCVYTHGSLMDDHSWFKRIENETDIY